MNLRDKLRNLQLLIRDVENWPEVLLVYMGSKREATARFKNRMFEVPVCKKNVNSLYNPFLGMKLMEMKQVRILREKDKFRIMFAGLEEPSPLLSPEPLCQHYYFIIRDLSELLRAGASYDEGILTLSLSQASVKFRIALWSEMPRVLYRTFYERLYERLLGRAVGGFIVDVGGYIGDTAIYFALSGASHVLAFEPVPYLHGLAVENVKLNGLDSIIEIKNVAIGGSYGKIELGMPDEPYGDWGHWAISAFIKGSKVADVPMVPLSDVLNNFDNIELVKLNCEGSEYPALETCDESTLKRSRAYIIQTHPHLARAPYDVIRKLRSSGFDTRVGTYGNWITAERTS